MLTLHAALALSAAVAAVYLVLVSPTKGWPALAFLAAAVEVAMAQAWLRLGLHAGTVQLALGLGLAIPALVLWWRVGGKGPQSAAAVLAFIGLLQTTLATLARL